MSTPQKRTTNQTCKFALPAARPTKNDHTESLTKPESLMTNPQATSLMSTLLSSLWPQAKTKVPARPAADDGVCRHRDGDKIGCEVWPPADAPAAAPATPSAAPAASSSSAAAAAAAAAAASTAAPAAAPTTSTVQRPLVWGDGGMADPLSIRQLTVDFWLSYCGMLTQPRTPAQLKQHAAQGEVEETLLDMTEPAFLLGRLRLVWRRMEQGPELFGLTVESIETFKAETGDGLSHIHVRFEQETERPDAPRPCFARQALPSGASPPPLELCTCTHAPQTCTSCTHKALAQLTHCLLSVQIQNPSA